MTCKGKSPSSPGPAVASAGPSPSAWQRMGRLVVVNYQKNAEAAAAVVREIEAAGGEAFAVQGDVGLGGRDSPVLPVPRRRTDQAARQQPVRHPGQQRRDRQAGDGRNHDRGGLRRTHGREREGPVLRRTAGHPPPAGRRPDHQPLFGPLQVPVSHEWPPTRWARRPSTTSP